MSNSSTLNQLLMRNRQWAQLNSGLFPNGDQTPRILWIGCSDSRVPESVIFAGVPGEVFTHRNIAKYINALTPCTIVQAGDSSVLSAIAFAVTALGVEHIVVVGHTNCGGVGICVNSAEDKPRCFNRAKEGCGPTEPEETTQWPPPPPLDTWLAPIRQRAEKLQPTTVLQLIKDNVQQQVQNVVQTATVSNNWAGQGKGKLQGVHGWLYHLEDGLVEDLGFSANRPDRSE
ncbi:uncharacterized protein PHACADRAFT_23743 [Phanerochaete carnosa HHB-10118-sp]|uniref:Carbonic anhydrase n=1 Tax=Phanerochaete carnosa (strain HHB-10118-sp) TaxID=650164 RepID=K5WMI4_PHACS|nr:uncharacterized protein PHACADRAFT_23743 [Phanerochaete carnosa HHB-10118-sp]EKM60384.1 hypothetical protein PHACADRAFT_23743 [Phanerochaete carnosa HHB-10118-sp]